MFSVVLPKLKEEHFYEPFAEYLKNDLDEVTEVASLGGAGLKGKWGTPDVIGVYKPLASNLIKFPLEIVAAEIKIDPQTPVVAFGQQFPAENCFGPWPARREQLGRCHGGLAGRT